MNICGLAPTTMIRAFNLMIIRRELENHGQVIKTGVKRGFIRSAKLLETFKRRLFQFLTHTLDGKLPDNGWGRLWLVL